MQKLNTSFTLNLAAGTTLFAVGATAADSITVVDQAIACIPAVFVLADRRSLPGVFTQHRLLQTGAEEDAERDGDLIATDIADYSADCQRARVVRGQQRAAGAAEAGRANNRNIAHD